MAKKPMTKAQIVSYFAKRFEFTRKTASPRMVGSLLLPPGRETELQEMMKALNDL
jgi:hypothetical protein